MDCRNIQCFDYLKIIFTIIGCILFILGLILNSKIIIKFSSPSYTAISTSKYFISLAVTDLLTLTLSLIYDLPYYLKIKFSKDRIETYLKSDVFCQTFYYLQFVFSTCSMWHVVILTLFEFINRRLPRISKKWLTQYKTCLYLPFIYIFSLASTCYILDELYFSNGICKGPVHKGIYYIIINYLPTIFILIITSGIFIIKVFSKKRIKLNDQDKFSHYYYKRLIGKMSITIAISQLLITTPYFILTRKDVLENIGLEKNQLFLASLRLLYLCNFSFKYFLCFLTNKFFSN